MGYLVTAPRVTEADLEHLPLLHELLALLSDAQAGSVRIEPLCRAIPTLERRLVDRARRKSPMASMMDLRRALAVIGNHGLEEVLLGYLEDLTIAKADRDDRQNGRARETIRR